MSGRTGAKLGAFLIAGVLVLYFAFSIGIAWALVMSGDLVSVLIGVGMIVLPLLGAWLIGRELVFGVQAERLVDIMAAEGSLPPDELPRHPSGRPVREAADAEFPGWKRAVEAAPDDWRGWIRLGLAYRASGDGGRARAAVRRAIELERASRA